MLRLLRVATRLGQHRAGAWPIKPFPVHGVTAVRDYQTATAASTSEPPLRISNLIKRDHAELKSIADKILKSTDPGEQTRFQNQFTWELARHAVGEELVMYPAFEKYLKDGEELADRDKREHQSVKDQLQVFQSLKSTDPRFIPVFKGLMEDLTYHIDDEEAVSVAKLDHVLSTDESVQLAQAFDRTKYFTPTRAHPRSPQTRPFLTAYGLMTAPIDRLADMLRKWP